MDTGGKKAWVLNTLVGLLVSLRFGLMYANRRNFLLLLVNISSISSQVLILKWIFAYFASLCCGFHF